MKKQSRLFKKQPKFISFTESETKKNYSVSIVLYSVIALLAILGIALMFNFFRSFTATNRFRNFTILSNVFMGMVAIMMVAILSIARKNPLFKIPKAVTIINVIATTCVALTMIVTILVLTPGAAILGPEKSGGHTPKTLFSRSNLVFHLVLPTLSIFACLCYAKTGQITIKDCLWSLIPIFVYLIFYIAIAYTHINPETGKPYPQWDTYKFCQFGPGALVGFAILIPSLYFGLTLLIRLGNQRIKVSKFFTNVLVQSVIISIVIGGACWTSGQDAIDTFKYFTNLSAFMMGISSVIYLVYICLNHQGKIKNIPTWVSVVRLATTSWVFITFFVVVFIFTPIKETTTTWQETQNLYEDRNLLFHIFVPLLAIASYLMLEHNKLHIKHTCWVLTFSIVYIIVYVALAYNGAAKGIDPKYCDWYYLYDALGKNWTWTLVIANSMLAYGLSFLLWYLNRRIHIGTNKDNNIFTKQLKIDKITIKH